MTYCIGIKTNQGVVLASDSRTNAGLDNVNIYSKMLTYDVGDRTIIIVTSGNLATSQAIKDITAAQAADKLSESQKELYGMKLLAEAAKGTTLTKKEEASLYTDLLELGGE